MKDAILIAIDLHVTTFSSHNSKHDLPLHLVGEPTQGTFICEACERENSQYAGPVIIYQKDELYWLMPRFEFYKESKEIINI